MDVAILFLLDIAALCTGSCLKHQQYLTIPPTFVSFIPLLGYLVFLEFGESTFIHHSPSISKFHSMFGSKFIDREQGSRCPYSQQKHLFGTRNQERKRSWVMMPAQLNLLVINKAHVQNTNYRYHTAHVQNATYTENSTRSRITKEQTVITMNNRSLKVYTLKIQYNCIIALLWISATTMSICFWGSRVASHAESCDGGLQNNAS